MARPGKSILGSRSSAKLPNQAAPAGFGKTSGNAPGPGKAVKRYKTAKPIQRRSSK